MTSLFKADSELAIKRILMQSKEAALKALLCYDLDWTQIRFNQLSDTCTFIIKTTMKRDFLLRIHSGMKLEEVNSELIWLDFLNEHTTIIAPKGRLDRKGNRTVRIDNKDGSHSYASLMHWVEGEHVGGELTDDQIYQEGVLLANLHQASQPFIQPAGFTRPVWDEISFKQAMEHLEQHYHKFLTDSEFRLYQSAAEKIFASVIKFHKDDDSYGFIHGDLHQGNIVFHNGEPRPIDFGRCGFGYFLHDIAQTILGLNPTRRELVVKGYESVRKLSDQWIHQLEEFSIMVMIENYSHHAPDLRETEGLKEEQPYAQAMLKKYINDEPFLFDLVK